MHVCICITLTHSMPSVARRLLEVALGRTRSLWTADESRGRGLRGLRRQSAGAGFRFPIHLRCGQFHPIPGRNMIYIVHIFWIILDFPQRYLITSP